MLIKRNTKFIYSDFMFTNSQNRNTYMDKYFFRMTIPDITYIREINEYSEFVSSYAPELKETYTSHNITIFRLAYNVD